MYIFRWILTVVAVIFALMFWYIALTVPMVSATAPVVIAVALTVGVFFVWPKRNKKVPV
jgi:hypothetical protein